MSDNSQLSQSQPAALLTHRKRERNSHWFALQCIQVKGRQHHVMLKYLRFKKKYIFFFKFELSCSESKSTIFISKAVILPQNIQQLNKEKSLTDEAEMATSTPTRPTKSPNLLLTNQLTYHIYLYAHI